MANWHKRRSYKSGNQGQRTTKTTSSTGKTTNSTSKRVGNVRTTYSTSSNGKMRVTTTEHHPILGTKRTTKTLNPTVKMKKSRPKKRRTSFKRSYKYNGSYATTTGSSRTIKIAVYSIIGVWLFTIFKFWLLIPLLLWLAPKWWRLVDEEIEEEQKSVDNNSKTD